MNSESGIVILTTTRYESRKDTRFHLACQLVGDAVGAGYDVFVMDGSPDPEIRVALNRIGAMVATQRMQGMGPGRRELYFLADKMVGGKGTPSKAFLWTEPEKVDLVRLIPEIVAPLLVGEADIVVPARSSKSFGTCPDFQAASEQMANDVFRVATGRSFDMLFGPVALLPKFLKLFADTDPPNLFGTPDGYIQQPAVMRAMAKGARVTGVNVEFRYPTVQREEEEAASEDFRAKRQSQLNTLSETFISVALKLGLKAR